jgi:hypothetical protein
MEITTIVFSDIEFKTLGTVEYDGTTLTPKGQAAISMVKHYESQGMTPAQFVEKFSSWSNGYLFAEVE